MNHKYRISNSLKKSLCFSIAEWLMSILVVQCFFIKTPMHKRVISTVYIDRDKDQPFCRCLTIYTPSSYTQYVFNVIKFHALTIQNICIYVDISWNKVYFKPRWRWWWWVSIVVVDHTFTHLHCMSEGCTKITGRSMKLTGFLYI